MNLLFLADRERFWAHLAPVASHARELGHHVHAAIPWSDAHGAGLVPVAHWLDASDVRVHWLSPGNRRQRLRALLTATPWHSILLCPEHLEPMRQVKPLVLATRGPAPEVPPAGREAVRVPGTPSPPRPIVFAMQHGLAQQFTPYTPDYCDHFLCWGELGRQVLNAPPPPDSGLFPRPVPITVTGTAKFDSYRAADAEDHNFILAHAPHVYGQPSPVTYAWVQQMARDVNRAGYGRLDIRVKVHCNDADWNRMCVENRIPRNLFDWVRPDSHPRDALRTCTALYLDYPSTAWVEAQCYDKPVILESEARRWLHNVPLQAALAARHVDALDNILTALSQETTP